MTKFLPRLAMLLCVFLFCAAIDTVPDPPAVTPCSQVHAPEGMAAASAAKPSEHLCAELLQYLQMVEETNWRRPSESIQKQPLQVELRREAANSSPPLAPIV